MKKSLWFMVFLVSFSLYGESDFTSADINSKDEVVCTLLHTTNGTSSYGSLFKASVEDGYVKMRPTLLTSYPEALELVNKDKIQTRNRYGRARYDLQTSTLTWDYIKDTLPINENRPLPYGVSYDGSYGVYIEPTKPGLGRLILEDFSNGSKLTLDEEASINYKTPPCKWEKERNLFVYEKKGKVYFCRPDSLFKGVEVGENFRCIGPGLLSSVNWTGSSNLIYVEGDMVYRISSKELYTLGLYSGVIGRGLCIGRLPSQFYPYKDKFYVNLDATSLVLVQNGRTFTHFKLFMGSSSDYLTILNSHSYVNKDVSLLASYVVWGRDSVPALWLKCLTIKESKLMSIVYKFNDKFTKIIEVSGGDPVFSEDNSRLAFSAGNSAYVLDATTFKKLSQVTGQEYKVLKFINNNSLIVGGSSFVGKWSVHDSKEKIYFLSSCINTFWTEDEDLVATTSDNKTFIFDSKIKCWSATDSVKNTKKIKNSKYRVFIGETRNQIYKSALYVRNLIGRVDTNPVFPETVTETPSKEKVSLVFDCYDCVDGLGEILYELKRYNIKATFFLNGEFIRRYPKEVKSLYETGNECASMFFTPPSLMNTYYRVDKDYVKRGLARNEDEFFNSTGKELSTVWHAPFYEKNSLIVQSGNEAGYTYIDCPINGLDVMTLEQSVSTKAPYFTNGEIIEIYLKALTKDKVKVFPITVGVSNGTREGYLYNDLDVLISTILDQGYEIVSCQKL